MQQPAVQLRDWSKSIGGWAGAERGWASVFEPLVRSGSFIFQLPLRGGSSFFYGDWHTFDNKGNCFQTIEASDTLKHQPDIGSHGSCFCLMKPHQHGIADGQK